MLIGGQVKTTPNGGSSENSQERQDRKAKQARGKGRDRQYTQGNNNK